MRGTLIRQINTDNKGRDFFFDNAKFFLILLVVLGHSVKLLDGFYMGALYRFIYLFHMPAFVFISGYFAKRQKLSGIIKLLFQYLFLQIIYSFFSAAIKSQNITRINYHIPYWILWFLFALIVWKSIMLFAVKFKAPPPPRPHGCSGFAYRTAYRALRPDRLQV